jgi:hypothetical protein
MLNKQLHLHRSPEHSQNNYIIGLKSPLYEFVVTLETNEAHLQGFVQKILRGK